MNRTDTKFKAFGLALAGALAFSAGCSGSTVPPEEKEPAPMNDVASIVRGMEELMGPSYATRGDRAVHLQVPEGYEPQPNRMLSLDWPDGWEFGHFTVRFDSEGRTGEVVVDISDDKIANNTAAALFASSVQGMTPEEGQRIADAMHLGDWEYYLYTQPKRSCIFLKDGYAYILEIGNYFRFVVIPFDFKPNYSKYFQVDIDGNDITPVPQTGGGGTDKQAVITANLTPPQSTTEKSDDGAVFIYCMSGYQDSLEWYKAKLDELKFVSLIPADQQALLDLDTESRMYSGKIDGQSVTVLVRDWRGTQYGDITMIMISFTAFGE